MSFGHRDYDPIPTLRPRLARGGWAESAARRRAVRRRRLQWLGLIALALVLGWEWGPLRGWLAPYLPIDPSETRTDPPDPARTTMIPPMLRPEETPVAVTPVPAAPAAPAAPESPAPSGTSFWSFLGFGSQSGTSSTPADAPGTAPTVIAQPMPENPSSVQLPAGTPVPDVPDAPDVPSKIGEPAASRDCQLPRAGTAAGYPVMIQIDKGNYVLKKTSHRARITPLLQAAGVADVVVTEPFLIQSREVTVDAFRVFVNAVAGWPEGPDKQRVQMYIGTQWGRAHQSVQERMEGGARVAMGLSREAAEEYVAWLSQTTGCAYRLPTREQWGAAVMSGVAAEDPQFLDALLHGAREWSNSRCPGGYVLLGEDPEASTADVARTRCMPAMLPVAGFRVLLSGEKKR